MARLILLVGLWCGLACGFHAAGPVVVRRGAAGLRMGATPRHEEAMLGELLQEVSGGRGCPVAVDGLCQALSAGFSDKTGSRALAEGKVWECLWPYSCRGELWTMQATRRVGQDMSR